MELLASIFLAEVKQGFVVVFTGQRRAVSWVFLHFLC